jgi:putative hemolysin
MRMKLCLTVLSLLLLAGLLCACAGQQAPVIDTTSDTTTAPSPVVPTATATEEDVDTVSTPTVEGSLDTASDPTIIRSMIPNPAAVYCVDLGYDYQIVEEARGQVGYCVLPARWKHLRRMGFSGGYVRTGIQLLCGAGL